MSTVGTPVITWVDNTIHRVYRYGKVVFAEGNRPRPLSEKRESGNHEFLDRLTCLGLGIRDKLTLHLKGHRSWALGLTQNGELTACWPLPISEQTATGTEPNPAGSMDF